MATVSFRVHQVLGGHLKDAAGRQGTQRLSPSILKAEQGLTDVPMTIANTPVKPGDCIYANKDGVLVSSIEFTGRH